MRIQSPFLTCCLATALLLPATAMSQLPLGGQRPAVGVALSGGSALGLAHIGVIRYFEEHHIPIDRIGGTSMGGLVGGLYASGMDSAQITTVAEQADWSALLNPSTPFTDQPVVDKQNWNRTFGKMTFRFGKGFSLPSGLNSGEALSLLLSHLTLAYSGVSNFDELPTPFRCVATDLVSGDAVVLDKGSLPLAMRATMSLPGVFTPVKLDGMVLVDGGVLENIPVDPVRNMGARTVIAIALETPNAKPEQFKSLPSVLRQTISLAIAKNEQRSLAKADLVISVNIHSSPRLTMGVGKRSLRRATGLQRRMPPNLRVSSYHLKTGMSISPSAANGRILPNRVADCSQSPAQVHLSRRMHRLSSIANLQTELCRSRSLRMLFQEWLQPRRFPVQPTNGSRRALGRAATGSGSPSVPMTRYSFASLACMPFLPASRPDSD